MNPQDAIDFSREAIMTCLTIGGPILVAGLVIGIIVGVFQAMTQVQDQTVSFVPKILLLLVMIGLCLPWLTDKMLGFAKQSFETPMTHWEGVNRVVGDSTSSDSTDFEIENNVEESSANLLASFSAPNLTPSPTFTSKPSTSFSTGDASRGFVAEPETVHPAISNPVAPQTEVSNNPFILPHYRVSKVPKSDIGG